MRKRNPPTNPRAKFHDLTNPLQKLRAFCGLTQHELRRALGVSQSVLAMWEVGSRRPSEKAIAKILEFAATQNVRISREELIYWQPQKERK